MLGVALATAAAPSIVRSEELEPEVRERYASARPFFWPAVVEAIVALSVAYRSFRDVGGSPNDYFDRINDVQDALSDITRTISRVKDQIAEIRRLIDQLPLAIRGQIDESNLNLELIRAKAAAQRIQFNIGNDVVGQNIDSLKQDISSLHTSISLVSALSPVYGLALTSPYLSLWLASSVTVEKYLLSQTSHSLQSPWKHPLMIEMEGKFTGFYEQFDASKANFDEVVVPHFPPYGKPRNVIRINDKFYFKPEAFVPIGKPQPEVFRVIAATGIADEKLQHRRFIPSTGDNPGPSLRWINVNENSPLPEQTEGLSAFRLFRSDRVEYDTFSSLAPRVFESRADVISAFKEPKNFWA